MLVYVFTRTSGELPLATTCMRTCITSLQSCVDDTPNTTVVAQQRARCWSYGHAGPLRPGLNIPPNLVGFMGCFGLADLCGALVKAPACLIPIRRHLSDHSCGSFCRSKSLRDAFCEAQTWSSPEATAAPVTVKLGPKV